MPGPVPVEVLLDDAELSDEELTRLALAADPDQPLDPDARPLDLFHQPGLLPASYMPPVSVRTGKRWQAGLALTIVVALLVIEAFGLCITYGVLTAA